MIAITVGYFHSQNIVIAKISMSTVFLQYNELFITSTSPVAMFQPENEVFIKPAPTSILLVLLVAPFHHGRIKLSHLERTNLT